ncbi:ComEC family competence protein [Flavobacteriaceae bacterium D16]|nr:ComEC family competence protein [Flavobacteriaceae bacterium D16]
MKPLDFLAVKLALLLILGMLLGYLMNIALWLCLLVSLGSIVALGIAYFWSNSKSIIFAVCAALTTISTGLLSYSLSHETDHRGHYQKNDLSKEHLWHLKILSPGKHTAFNRIYLATVLSLDQKPARGRVQLRIKHTDSPSLKIDNEILAWGSAQKITKALNPYQWDYGKYLENRNVYHQIRASTPYIYPLPSSKTTIRGWASDLRNNLINKLELTGIQERELSIIQAILLGERANISQETFDMYRKAGAIHILAISGLHVGIILLLLRLILRPLTRLTGGKTLALILSVILLWGYALLAGFSPSVIRAVTMFSFLTYSLFLNRLSYGHNTLALSLLFLLLVINPLLIFEVGFQMSYAAVGAILWIYPVLIRTWRPSSQIINRIWQISAVSLAAQLGVLPVSLFYFHQFPGLFLLSSLVIIPFLGLILGSGFILIFLAMLNRLPDLLVEGYQLIIFLLNEFIGWVSNMQIFHLDNLPFGPLELILSYLFLYFFISTLQSPKAKRLPFLLVVFLLIQSCGIFYVWHTGNTERLLIGHHYGDALLIKQQGKRLAVYTPEKTVAPPSLIRNYQLGARTRQLEHLPLENSYLLNGQTIIRLDSNVILLKKKEINYLWLTYSPKINLDRYLASYAPGQIIADGSSPPYLVDRWQESAGSRNIPFHYTGKDGAFEFK